MLYKVVTDLQNAVYYRLVFLLWYFNFFFQVILCGGGCNMPVLQKAVTDMFSHCDILNSINPEEVIAIGAAKQVECIVYHTGFWLTIDKTLGR